MQIKLSTPYYIGAFVVLFIVILILLVISPTQNSFFELKEVYPSLYYNLHENPPIYDQLIQEILKVTGISRIDIEQQEGDVVVAKEPTKAENATIQTPTLEWLEYSPETYDYIRGKVHILPLYYNDKLYDNHLSFPTLMRFMRIVPGIFNIYFWKLGPESALLQHPPKRANGTPNIHEDSVLDKKIYRYTLAINVLSCVEEECSIWVGGHLKKLIFDKYVLWDPSKEFSLHNDSATDGDVLFLNIDLLH
jgi:hypothetical protein